LFGNRAIQRNAVLPERLARAAGFLRRTGAFAAPEEVPAFPPVDESSDFAIRVPLKDFAHSRLPRDEENIAHFNLQRFHLAALAAADQLLAVPLDQVNKIGAADVPANLLLQLLGRQ
jgi:hypothetical protein